MFVYCLHTYINVSNVFDTYMYVHTSTILGNCLRKVHLNFEVQKMTQIWFLSKPLSPTNAFSTAVNSYGVSLFMARLYYGKTRKKRKMLLKFWQDLKMDVVN